jgi:hypothetical protein
MKYIPVSIHDGSEPLKVYDIYYNIRIANGIAHHSVVALIKFIKMKKKNGIKDVYPLQYCPSCQ